jgi:hypothetical protein
VRPPTTVELNWGGRAGLPDVSYGSIFAVSPMGLQIDVFNASTSEFVINLKTAKALGLTVVSGRTTK